MANLLHTNRWTVGIAFCMSMISPILLFTLVMGLIGTMRYFAQACVTTAGGPWHGTLFYALNPFNTAFTEYRLGYASAMAWIMFAIILTVTLTMMKLSNRFVYCHS
ncbi:MAG: sugar ABC transporter permease [Phycisphaerae bacterium]|nr:sugar ABC transporter permease [Phycisphaerae bacterium]